jgi:hypothetical protein
MAGLSPTAGQPPQLAADVIPGTPHAFRPDELGKDSFPETLRWPKSPG